MSKAKANPAVAIVVFFGAILLFSQSASILSKSSSTQNALRPATASSEVLTADGTMPPPPVSRPRPNSLS
jgi:hypothetical protein